MIYIEIEEAFNFFEEKKVTITLINSNDFYMSNNSTPQLSINNIYTHNTLTV